MNDSIIKRIKGECEDAQFKYMEFRVLEIYRLIKEIERLKVVEQAYQAYMKAK